MSVYTYKEYLLLLLLLLLLSVADFHQALLLARQKQDQLVVHVAGWLPLLELLLHDVPQQRLHGRRRQLKILDGQVGRPVELVLEDVGQDHRWHTAGAEHFGAEVLLVPCNLTLDGQHHLLQECVDDLVAVVE